MLLKPQDILAAQQINKFFPNLVNNQEFLRQYELENMYFSPGLQDTIEMFINNYEEKVKRDLQIDFINPFQ